MLKLICFVSLDYTLKTCATLNINEVTPDCGYLSLVPLIVMAGLGQVLVVLGMKAGMRRMQRLTIMVTIMILFNSDLRL